MDVHDAIAEITKLAQQHNLAVSVVTVDDVLQLKGADSPTDAQRDEVIASYEWNTYGSNWSAQFEGLTLS